MRGKFRRIEEGQIPQGRIDLHIHTTCSDGSLSPEAVVERAFQRGMTAIAITDHDTVAGVERAQTAAPVGMEVIAGVEISAAGGQGLLHILGYFVDSHDALFLEKLQNYVEARNERNPKILAALADNGCPLGMEEIVALSGGEVVNRPHIARAMVSRGYVKTTQEAFDRYLNHDAPAYFPKEIYTLAQTIQIIHEAGGLAVLAHPDQLYNGNMRKIRPFIAEAVTQGLDGIEAYHGTGLAGHGRIYQAIAEEHELFITGGSDFHGIQPYRDIGEMNGVYSLPNALVEEMKARLETVKARGAI